MRDVVYLYWDYNASRYTGVIFNQKHTMQKFLVLYCMPIMGLEDWMKKPEAERKAAEQQMQEEWNEWANKNAAMIVESGGAGKTKRSTANGIADVKNDVMLYSLVEADSHEAATKIFEGHPHLQIPGSWIDIMPMNKIPGMK